MPPRRLYGVQVTGHAPTAVIRGQGVQARLHGGHTGPWKPTTPQQMPYGAQKTGHAPTAAMRYQGNRHAFTAALQVQGDQPRSDGGLAWSIGQATPSLRPCGDQGTGLAPTAAIRGLGTGHTPTAGIRSPGDRPPFHGGFARPRGPSTPPMYPYGSQGTGHVST